LGSRVERKLQKTKQLIKLYQSVVSSRVVAEQLEEKHKHVLESIALSTKYKQAQKKELIKQCK